MHGSIERCGTGDQDIVSRSKRRKGTAGSGTAE